jgi:hypothetical protein
VKGAVSALLMGIGLRSAYTSWGSIRGKVGFTLELFELNQSTKQAFFDLI